MENLLYVHRGSSGFSGGGPIIRHTRHVVTFPLARISTSLSQSILPALLRLKALPCSCQRTHVPFSRNSNFKEMWSLLYAYTTVVFVCWFFPSRFFGSSIVMQEWKWRPFTLYKRGVCESSKARGLNCWQTLQEYITESTPTQKSFSFHFPTAEHTLSHLSCDGCAKQRLVTSRYRFQKWTKTSKLPYTVSLQPVENIINAVGQ